MATLLLAVERRPFCETPIECGFDTIRTQSETSSRILKNNFMPRSYNNLKSTMERLDYLKIDPDILINNYIFDIVISLLFILSFITTVLCLISLHTNNMTIIFYILLSLFMIGSLGNIAFAVLMAYSLTQQNFPNKSDKFHVLIYVSMLSLSIFIAPIMFAIYSKDYNIYDKWKDSRRLMSFWVFALIVSLPQSLMMIILIMLSCNIFFILSFIFNALSVIMVIICISAENKQFQLLQILAKSSKQNLNHSFLLYLLCWMIDYFTIFFMIIYCFYDTDNIVVRLYFYNALVGVPLMATQIAYKEGRHWAGEPSNAVEKIIIIFLCYILSGILCVAVVEATCCVFLPIAYNHYKEYVCRYNSRALNHIDWNLLSWIVNNITIDDKHCNILNYFNVKDKICRLCMVNALILDTKMENHSDAILKRELCIKEYLIKQCKTNFNNASLKQLKNKKSTIKNWIVCSIFDADDGDGNIYMNAATIYKIICFMLYIISRVIRFIFLPIFIMSYFIFYNYNECNIIVWIVIILQCLSMVIVGGIVIVICNEIHYSFCLISFGNYVIKSAVRKNIGYYYNAATVYQLYSIINKQLGSDIANVIVSFLAE